MAKLLECQQDDAQVTKEAIKEFAFLLLERLLEIYESDLVASEMRELEDTIKDWEKIQNDNRTG